MSKLIPNGVWPTLITPFTETNEIDYAGVENLIKWYLERGVDGLFAVCQSSESFQLSVKERVQLAEFICKKVNGNVPVIAGGNFSDSLTGQVEEIKAMSQTGVTTVVLLANRLAHQAESETVWKQNLEYVLSQVPDIEFGLYECPSPYHRLIPADTLKWVASTNRFHFIKETSCNIEKIKEKLNAVQQTDLKIYNANSTTLLESLKLGVAGYSGIMANFHPDLYVWLMKHWSDEPEKARKLQDFLGVASVFEQQMYPTNAKYYIHLDGVNINYNSRVQNKANLTLNYKLELQQLHALSKQYSKEYIFQCCKEQ